MKKYLIFSSIVLSLGFLFTVNALDENAVKSTWTTKSYCFFYPSRCEVKLSKDDVKEIVATTTKSLETKIEDKGIVTNVMSWIRSLKSNRIETKLLCVEDVCVNKGQFLKIVQLINKEAPIFTVSFTSNDGSGTTTKIITR